MDQNLEAEQIKSTVESLIFISEKPLLLEDLKKIFEHLESAQIRDIIEILKKEYEGRLSGIRIVEMAGGFHMVTAPESAEIIKKFYKIKHTEKLSGPSLETLAIIAYKQPVTRVDIEAIRGVNVDGVVKSLTEKGLIRIVGRKEVIGRPFVYGTTRQFMDYFGLKSLDELPKIEDFVPSDLDLNIDLVSGEGVITPLTKEEETTLNAAAAAPLEGEDNENQKPA